MTVLIVEADSTVRQLVGEQLESRGLRVTAVGTVGGARHAMGDKAFEVVILDVDLPDGSGRDVLDELRQRGSAAHVIVLSGAGTEGDRISGLEHGADDYVVKPFFVRELTARVLAVGRRLDPEEESRLRAGHLEIDVAARQVTSSGAPLELTAKEFDLLAFLAARPGHVFSRSELLVAVWNSASDWQQATTVTEHVRRLRTKIELDPQQPQLLVTVRGTGYRFDLPDEATPAQAPQPASEPVGGALVYVDGHVVAADAGFVALTGWEETELIGRPVVDLAAPGWADASEKRRRRVAEGKSVRSELGAVKHRDGTEVPVEVSSSAVVWDGQPGRRVAITPVVDAARRLRQLVTGVVTEVSDAVIVTDPHFHIRSWNRAAERLYGWAEAEVLGRHLLDILPWRGGTVELVAAGESLEATGRWHGRARQLTRDGSEVVVQGTTRIVRADGGEPIGIVAINRVVLPAPRPVEACPPTRDEADIRRGLDNGEFKVYYQPLVLLEDASVFAVEALVRWNHPEEGLLGPEAFIHTAEQSDLIVDLGGYVLDRACRDGVAWRQAGLALAVGVNLSAREVADRRLEERVMATLDRTGMDPLHLWLEVTETALVEDVEEASVVLHRLAGLGIRISIDDFGTGWASLTYLKQFPVHALKIDRSFVEGIDSHANDAAIARSIASLGAELGLAVVAEGIETRAQQRTLQELGCSQGQGYLYGRPTPAALVPVHRVQRIATGSTGHPVASPSDPAAAPEHVPAVAAGQAVARPATPADPVVDTLRALLRIRSAQAAAQLLQLTVKELGAAVVPATEAGPDALPLDLSLGVGPPVLAVADLLSPARLQLDAILPRLVDDARHAVDLLRENERLEEETNHDPLTGLVNRRVLERVLARAHDGAVVMIDLDHFKRTNDTLGHAAGDTVLARFGHTLRHEVRATDTTCRLGGEEFVVVSPGVDEPAAVSLVDRIRTAWVDVAPHTVTFSAGLATVDELGGTAALLAADRALYRAKRLGRNRTEIDRPGPHFEALR